MGISAHLVNKNPLALKVNALEFADTWTDVELYCHVTENQCIAYEYLLHALILVDMTAMKCRNLQNLQINLLFGHITHVYI